MKMSKGTINLAIRVLQTIERELYRKTNESYNQNKKRSYEYYKFNFKWIDATIGKLKEMEEWDWDEI